MENKERIRGIMTQRTQEMFALARACRDQRPRVDLEWLADCVATTGTMLVGRDAVEDVGDLLMGFALAMWQKGYEAAPKLEFILPEGAKG